MPPAVRAQVEVARLEQSLRSLNKQLGEAEADYLTGTERLAALRREVSGTMGNCGEGRCCGTCIGSCMTSSISTSWPCCRSTFGYV